MEKKSPLKDKPLRYAGESLDREISRLNDDMFFKYGVYAAFFFAVAIVEWLRYATNAQPDPILYTVVAVIVIAFSAYKIVRMKKRINSLKLGRDGERIVGEYLDRLRSKGYSIFHDVVGDGFNIDHVVCAPSGIYTIETKTMSKPIKGEAKIIYNGKKILVDGLELDRDPLIQSKAQADWLHSILLESTGKKYSIQPVILFPGWFVESPGSQSAGPAWVLNPKALPAFIEDSKQKIIESDIHLATFHLARYIRSHSK